MFSPVDLLVFIILIFLNIFMRKENAAKLNMNDLHSFFELILIAFLIFSLTCIPREANVVH